MNYFVFNDIDTRSLGIRLEGVPPVQRGKERVTSVTIPGRAGTLTITEGDESFEPYIQGIAINVPAVHLKYVLSWLKGSGYITFSNDPEKKQLARVINALNLTKASKHLEWYKLMVQFTCQPLKEDVAEIATTVSSGDTLVNLGDVTEKPCIEIAGKGVITLSIDGKPFTLTDVERAVKIDSDAEEMVEISTNNLVTEKSSGDFPVFKVGRNVIEFTGNVDSVRVIRKQRYL